MKKLNGGGMNMNLNYGYGLNDLNQSTQFTSFQGRNTKADLPSRIHSLANQEQRATKKHPYKFPELKLKTQSFIQTSSKQYNKVNSNLNTSTNQSNDYKTQNIKYRQPDVLPLDSKTKRALSLQCKNNFIQFLLVQKAGKIQKPGSTRFFDNLKQAYAKQLFGNSTNEVNQTKLDKTKISYLHIQDENPQEITNQVQSILNKKATSSLRGMTPLNIFIQKIHAKGRFHLPELHNQDMLSNSDIKNFNI